MRIFTKLRIILNIYRQLKNLLNLLKKEHQILSSNSSSIDEWNKNYTYYCFILQSIWKNYWLICLKWQSLWVNLINTLTKTQNLNENDDFTCKKFGHNFILKDKAEIKLFKGFINFDIFLKTLKSIKLCKQSFSVAINRIEANNLIMKKF
jgi:hypothetical protein